MRVLLINSNTRDDLLAAPPLGLCYVATAAEAAGHQVQVLDLCFARGKERRAVGQATRVFSPDVIGVSVRNIDNCNMLYPEFYLPHIRRISGYIRQVTGVPLVVGGSGASLCPGEILNYLGANYVVVSDGEESFVQLLAVLETGRSPEAIPGVGMMREGRFHLTPPTRTGFPAGDPHLDSWIDLRPYYRMGSGYSIQTKRGCRQRCIYCTYNQSLEGSGIRFRAPVEVVDELEEVLRKHHPPTFDFVDSVFNDPLEHSVEILEEIIRRPWRAHLTTMGVNPLNLDRAYLDLMWRAGFRSFMITPESASGAMLRNYRKGFGPEDVARAAGRIHETGFATWWYFMVGGPGETNATLQESLDFATRHLASDGRRGSTVAHFFLGVRMYPGTQLWEMGLQEGQIPEGADPLQLIWYLSRDLDLARALDQMARAAASRPGIYLGSDDRILRFSRTLASVCRILGRAGPYWRYFSGTNLMRRLAGVRLMYRSEDLARWAKGSPKGQGP